MFTFYQIIEVYGIGKQRTINTTFKI